jgi:hypothetical protein
VGVPSVRGPVLLSLLLAALVAVGCGDDSGGGGSRDVGAGGPFGDYPGEPDLSPEEVARAYVEALDARDGERFCGLVAPYISGGYDIAVRDQDSALRSLRDCPGFVSAYIGYVEDCCPPEFKAAEVERLREGRPHGELRGFDLVIRLHLVENGEPRVERLADRVWLARLEGAWRVAKLSAVARAASLAMPHFDEPAGAEEDPLAPPDLAEEQRLFAAAVEDFGRRAERRSASYRQLGRAADCSGGLSIDDEQADQEWNGAGPAEDPPHVPGGDITRVRVAVRGEEVCVRWDLAGSPEQGIFLSYGHREGPSTGQFFDVEVRDDGTARATSGDDDRGRPIPVPAEVGVGDAAVTLTLGPESFRAGQREWSNPEPPPLEDFGISASSLAKAGADRSVRDQLGLESSATFRYPDGRICRLEGC